MRKQCILLVFSMVASLVVWNSFGVLNGETFLAEEPMNEEVEFENSMGEEEESRNFEDPLVAFVHSVAEVEHEYASQQSFCYAFTIRTFYIEPEEYPPCC